MQSPKILYEDNHLIIVNKQVGDLVQGDRTGDEPLSEKIKKYIKEKHHKPGNVYLGVAHRLDRPTSGAVIFARTSKALSRLNKMLKEKKIEKTYWAIVKKPIKRREGSLVHYLKKNPKNNKSTAFDRETQDAKRAVLHFKVIKEIDNYALLEINLETGRHHQIRTQLAKVGMPIQGDLKYGFPRSNKNGGISLHARRLVFVHPVSKEQIMVNAPLPKSDVWELF